MDNICSGTKKNGDKCTYKRVVGEFCKIHSKTTPVGKPCVTITLGDVAENNVGMQKIGTEAKSGFSFQDLQQIQEYFEERKCVTELHYLDELLVEWSQEGENSQIEHEDAYFLVVRGGANILLQDLGKNADDMLKEQLALKWDTKAKMKGKVVNKIARHNLCYADKGQDADFENGKGTIIPFSDLPCLNFIRGKLHEAAGEKAKNLVAEGNLYYDSNACGIKYHGDSERNIVIAIRLGESMPLYYQWYYRTEKVGKMFEITLNHSDLYVMSEFAVGKKWRSSSILTLRHAAGKRALQ